MGGKGSGRLPDWERQRRIVELRRDGLSIAEIAQQVGISRQGVHHVLRTKKLPTRGAAVKCSACGATITRLEYSQQFTRPVLCRACLAKRPHATFGQRLQTFRLAAGLTVKNLEARTGISPVTLRAYERDEAMPKPSNLAKLVRVLGAGLKNRE